MHLGDIFDDRCLDAVTAAIEVERVEIDSRCCEPGTLFFAMPGATTTGANYALQAVANGAVAVVAANALDLPVPVLVVPQYQLALALAHAAASVTRWPTSSFLLVGITGTNGKTSVATIVAALAEGLGWSGAAMGTLTNVRTTPAAPELWRSFRAIADRMPADRQGVVALEVSSHAIDQDRVAGVPFAVVAFTNLSHDHLDYHGTMDAYFEAKAALFTPEHASRAVIWVDDPYGAQLAERTGIPTMTVRRSDATNVRTTMTGTTFEWRGEVVTSPLIGAFNLDNALMAMAIMVALGAAAGDVATAMATVAPVPGRFEVVHDEGPLVVVDYAHTPDGLSRVLHAVRTLHNGRIITVFGCGGERDALKRPRMGEVAVALSDEVIVTSDNPRHEEPEYIIDAIVSTLPEGSFTRITDRRAAIAHALARAGANDVVVIAGKGHESTQTIGDDVLAFDDRVVARELLK